MKNTLLIILIFFVSSCSYKVTKNYQTSDSSNQFSNNCNPVIVKKKDLYGLHTKYLGTIKLDDSGLSINCSEEKAIEILQNEACLLNSNLINITEEVKHGYSSCYRCIAMFYNVDFDPTTNTILESANRKKIKYDPTAKINWSDFKLSLPDSSSIPYQFISNLEVKSGSRSFWMGEFKSFNAQGVFYCDVSKVKPSFATDENLLNIEMLYNLTQIFAKRLEQNLNSDINKTTNHLKIQNIIELYLENLLIEQKLFIKETEYGKNKIVQQKWINKINMDLKELKIK